MVISLGNLSHRQITILTLGIALVKMLVIVATLRDFAMAREWRHIPGTEGYEASDMGEVLSKMKGVPHLMRPHKHGRWWKLTVKSAPITLSNGEVRRHMIRRPVAEFVMEAFGRLKPSEYHEPGFKNGMQDDFRIDNLYWRDIRSTKETSPVRVEGSREVRLREPTEYTRWAPAVGFGLDERGYHVSNHGHLRKPDGELVRPFQLVEKGPVYVRLPVLSEMIEGVCMLAPMAALVTLAWHGRPLEPARILRRSQDMRDLAVSNFSWMAAAEPELDPLVSQPHKPGPEPDPDPKPAGTVVPPPAPPADDEDDDVVPLGF